MVLRGTVYHFHVDCGTLYCLRPRSYDVTWFAVFFCVLHATFVSRIGMDVLRVLPFQVAFFGGHVFFFIASPSTAILLLQSESFFFQSVHFFCLN